MNTPLSLLAAVLVLTGASSALAKSNADLSVTGMITPSACEPSLSSGGVVEHGRVGIKDLDPDQPTRLENGTLYLDVNCEAATLFTLTTVDNRSGSSAILPTQHGLGVVNNDEKLGSVGLGLFDAIADGTAVKTIASRDDGASWRASPYLGHAGKTSFAALNAPDTPIAIKDLHARLTAFTTIVRASDLTLTDEIPIDGHITVQLNY